MKVEAVSINQVFLNNRILKIPFFQRGYVWEKKNWEQFFNDIANVASMEENEMPEKYFLGSIILKDAGFKSGSQQYDVIDGQQRLTTIVMFMKALYLALGRNDLFNIAFMQMSLTGETKPILITNYNDQYVYNEIVNRDSISLEPIVNNNRLAEAFAYFAGRIIDARKPVDGSAPITPAALLQAVINYVRLVAIEVQEGENAQKIFETINCAGIKLTTGEMLKNFLFSEDRKDDYERIWKPVFENRNRSYWEGEMVNGRIQDSHIENFFYRYMLIKMQEPAIKSGLTVNETKAFRQKDGLFEKFRHMINKFGITKESAINEIVDYARLYLNTFKKDILDDTAVQYGGIERLVYFMYAMDSWTMTPYILYILRNVESDTEKTRLFHYMENYLVRRTICKSKNNNYSDMFSENLIGQNINTYEGFKAYVNDAANRGALLMPSDEDVVKAVKENDLKRDALTILYLLESKVNDTFQSSERDNSYNTFVREQVMPERADDNWPLGLGYNPEQRKDIAKTLGNFVILREKLKSKAKSAKWTEKRNAMRAGVVDLSLFQAIENNLPSWDETTIEERNKWIAGKVLDAWPK